MSRTNEITKAIVTYLNMNDYFVWRQNNMGVYNEKRGRYMKNPNNKRGVADVIGLKWDGTFFAVEVKYGKDKQSPEQIEFQAQVEKRNGIYYIAKSFDDFLNQFECTESPE